MALGTELSKNAKTEEEMGLAMFGSVIGSGIAEIIIDKKQLVDNYFDAVSVGLFLKEKKRLYP